MKKFSIIMFIVLALDLGLVVKFLNASHFIAHYEWVQGIDVILISILGFVGLSYLLYIFLEDKINNKVYRTIYNVYMVVSCIPLIVIISVMLMFCFVNILYSQQLKPTSIEYQYTYNTKLERNFEECSRLLMERKDKVAKYENSLSDKIVKKLNTDNYMEEQWDDALNDRMEVDNQIYNFLLENIIEYPVSKIPESIFDEDSQDQGNSIGGDLKSYFREEVVRIQRDLLVHKKDKQEPVKRYIGLWRILNNLYNSKNNEMMSTLVYQLQEGDLLKCFESIGQEITIEDIAAIKPYLEDIIIKKDMIQKEKWARDFTDKKQMFSMKGNPGFPFFNYNDTINQLNVFSSYSIKNCNVVGTYKYDPDSEENLAYEKLLKELQEMRYDTSFFANPLGTTLFRISASMNSGVDVNINRKKGKLVALKYLLEKNRSSETPVDSFSGRKMVFTDKIDIYEISGYFDRTAENNSGKPDYKFVIRKPNTQ